MPRKPEMGKYLLWLFFNRSPYVRRYLPATKRYSGDSLKEFVRKYSTVYVKPQAGSRGIGIFKVWKQAGRIWVQKTIFRPKSFQTLDDAVRFINTECRGKAYMVQRGIHLAKVDGRPFDIRVMMQREKPGGQWLYSGMLAKIAGRGSIVTNVAMSRGSVMEVDKALFKSFGWNKQKIQDCMNEMIKLSFQSAKHFDNYLLYRELGFDVAVDQSGRVWMIEQNTAPSHPLFAHLKSNLRMFRTIQARWGNFARALRR